MQGPTHEEIDIIDSQHLVEAISPPRSSANRSSTNDYEASVVRPIAHSYDTRNTKKDAEHSPLYPYMTFCVFCGLHISVFLTELG